MTQKRLIGYLENWEDISSWGGGVNNMCETGCMNFESVIKYTEPFTTINYAFILVSQNWYSGYDPSGGCSNYNVCGGGGGCPNCDSTWPAQDGDKSLYWIPKCRGSPAFSSVIDMNTTISTPTKALLNIREIGRLCRQHPSGPKEFNLCLGGWSDCITIQKGFEKELAQLVANAVLITFADGIDLDFEHFSIKKSGDILREQNERDLQISTFATFIINLREQLDIAQMNWNAAIVDCNKYLDKLKNDPSSNITDEYYNSNKFYLNDLCKLNNKKLTITYTTRFNAFISGLDLGYSTNFVTDNEGTLLYQKISSNNKGVVPIDYINFMNYDGNLPNGKTYVDWFTNIIDKSLENKYLSPKNIVVGIEPGTQAGAPSALDQKDSIPGIIDLVNSKDIGGMMVWAINNRNSNNTLSVDSQIIEYFSKIQNKGNYYSDLSQIFSLCDKTGYITSKICQAAPLKQYSSNNYTSTKNIFLSVILPIISILICIIICIYAIMNKLWLTNIYLLSLLIIIVIGLVVTSIYLINIKQSCIPNCTNKNCGTNGCKGSCGSCPDGHKCKKGKCVALPPPSLKYDCDTNGKCIQKTDGRYITPNCDNNCKSPPPPPPSLKYDCDTNGKCIQKTDGRYITPNCDNNCKSPPPPPSTCNICTN